MSSTVIWGLSSSISIYKAVEAIRLLTREGDVRVVAMLSSHATQFIQPLLIEALTHAPVYTADETMTADHHILHTTLARQADVLVFAPATAHLIARLAWGHADDLLTTTALAYDGPVIIAPAMHFSMWLHPATRQNVETLQRRGCQLVGPDVGPHAEGDEGPGRLVEPPVLVEAVRTALQRRMDLLGQTVLVTAGPTREPIDPVRFVSNYASGKMGFALAEVARQRGAHVILISGPTTLIPHPALEFYSVETAQEMAEVVFQHAQRARWIVKAAAVADYRPHHLLPRKREKSPRRWTLEMEPTVDILATLGTRKRSDQILIGFAAETERGEARALKKLRSKNLDFVVLNEVGPGKGFAVDTNQVTVWSRDGRRWDSPLMSKVQLAHWLWDRWIETVTVWEKACP